jgi:hypothetical protein
MVLSNGKCLWPDLHVCTYKTLALFHWIAESLVVSLVWLIYPEEFDCSVCQNAGIASTNDVFTYNIFTMYQQWKEELTKIVSIDTPESNFWIWNFVSSKILFQYKVQWSLFIEIIRFNYQGSSPKIISYFTGLSVYSYINHSNFGYGRNPMYCYLPCYLSWIITIIGLSEPSWYYLC